MTHTYDPQHIQWLAREHAVEARIRRLRSVAKIYESDTVPVCAPYQPLPQCHPDLWHYVGVWADTHGVSRYA